MTIGDDRRGREADAYRAWYRTARWRKRRTAQLRENPLCAKCLNKGIVTAATVAHHLIPHRGDAALFWNGELQSLCAPHHDSNGQSEDRRGFSKEVGVDGWPIDPNHPANRATG